MAYIDSLRQYYSNTLGWGTEKAGRQKVADTQLAATEQEELAARNEATAERQNAAARMPRQNPRAGGSRYTRRGLWTPGGSGLNQANAAARTEARRKASYAQIDDDYEQRFQSAIRMPSMSAPQQLIRLW